MGYIVKNHAHELTSRVVTLVMFVGPGIADDFLDYFFG